MDIHPELEAEQAYVERAYERLDRLRADTEERLRSVLDQGRGGTHQFREERDVIVRTSLARLDQLDIGDQALCFGRIDRLAGAPGAVGVARGAGGAGGAGVAGGVGGGDAVESFHIGRLGISGEDLEPLVVDWRAPVAEPFYRATGRDPMGLVLRRHLASHGRRVVGIEDERFGPGGARRRGAEAGAGDGSGRADGAEAGEDELELGGPGALLAALSGARTGHMRDIVATIQAEQDEIIRARLPGVLVVQGGPGTGKTAVALHRAAYLLYTFRFPLERQGVLVIGPNPLFLRYIEHVLPSLGESGVTLSTISGLVRAVSVRAEEPPEVARLKGEARMARLVARAVRTRQRTLRREAVVPYGSTLLRITPELSADVVAAARRRPGTHNSRRRFVEQMLVRRLAEQYERALQRWSTSTRASGTASLSPAELEAAARLAGEGEEWELGADAARHAGGPEPGLRLVPPPGPPRQNGATGTGGARRADRGTHADDGAEGGGLDVAEFGRRLRRVPELIDAMDRIWPRLTAQELLHDLYGAPALLSLASKGVLTPAEQQMLVRPRSRSLADIPWTTADVALIDEARALLGPRSTRPVPPGAGEPTGPAGPGTAAGSEDEAPRTYGHIVVDEAQDLSPMQLRMVARRSLSGSVTVVGDIGQATGPWAPADWDEVTAHLPRHRTPLVTELTVSYRTPAEVVEVAAAVLGEAAPQLRPPRPVRRTGEAPHFVAAPPEELAATVARVAAELSARVTPGTTAVLAPASLVADLAVALDAAGVAAADPRNDGLGAPLSLLPVDLANGLEFDAVVVVEPASVVDESPQGLRGLYVALTRPTRILGVVHARGLPPSLAWAARAAMAAGGAGVIGAAGAAGAAGVIGAAGAAGAAGVIGEPDAAGGSEVAGGGAEPAPSTPGAPS